MRKLNVFVYIQASLSNYVQQQRLAGYIIATDISISN